MITKYQSVYSKKIKGDILTISFRIPMDPKSNVLINNLYKNISGLHLEQKVDKLKTSVVRRIINISYNKPQINLELIRRGTKILNKESENSDPDERVLVNYEYSNFKNSEFKIEISFIRNHINNELYDIIMNNNVIILEECSFNKDRDSYNFKFDVESSDNKIDINWKLSRARKKEDYFRSRGKLDKRNNLYLLNLRDCNELFRLFSVISGVNIVSKKFALLTTMIEKHISLEVTREKDNSIILKFYKEKRGHESCIKGDVFYLNKKFYIKSNKTLEFSNFNVSIDFDKEYIVLR